MKKDQKKETVRVCIYCKNEVKKPERELFDYYCKKCDEDLLKAETREVEK